MKKSIHLLNQSLLSKISRFDKDNFLSFIPRHIDWKRFLQATAAILFTAVLSHFGADAAETPLKFPDPAVTAQDSSDAAHSRDFSSTVRREALESGFFHSTPEESTSGCAILPAPSFSADTASSGNYGSTAWRASGAASAEQPDPDLDLLLSVVDSLPGEETLFCSCPDVLFSPQAETLWSTLEAFQETGRSLGFILLDLHSGNSVSFNPDGSFYSASTMKGPYVAALNKFSPEAVDDYTKDLMENTIVWSSNEDYETLHYLYGNDVMFDMTEYTAVSDSVIDDYNWYPYLTVKELTQLWIGTYFYFFEDTNEHSAWCRNLFTDTAESFIGSALGDVHRVYTKAGWYTDWEDTARNDAGIIRADGHDYILTVMSDSFDSYDDLEELTAALDELRPLLYSGEMEMMEAAADPS